VILHEGHNDVGAVKREEKDCYQQGHHLQIQASSYRTDPSARMMVRLHMIDHGRLRGLWRAS
jgi:hypothetical protein